MDTSYSPGSLAANQLRYPCPFCGNANTTLVRIQLVYDPVYAVMCLSCRAQGPHAESNIEARDKWRDWPKNWDATTLPSEIWPVPRGFKVVPDDVPSAGGSE
jgi:hypothetical protein